MLKFSVDSSGLTPVPTIMSPLCGFSAALAAPWLGIILLGQKYPLVGIGGTGENEYLRGL